MGAPGGSHPSEPPSGPLFTEAEFLAYIQDLWADRVNQEIAESLGYASDEHVRQIRNGKRKPGPEFLRRLGFERVVLYWKVKP